MKHLLTLIIVFSSLFSGFSQPTNPDVHAYSQTYVSTLYTDYSGDIDSISTTADSLQNIINKSQHLIDSLSSINLQKSYTIDSMHLVNAGYRAYIDSISHYMTFEGNAEIKVYDTVGYDIRAKTEDNNYWLELFDTHYGDSIEYKSISMWLLDDEDHGKLELWVHKNAESTLMFRWDTDSTRAGMDFRWDAPMYLFED